MTLTDLQTVAETLYSMVSSLAILIGGGWAYWKFVVQREREPRLDFDLEADFFGVQDGKWIVEISGRLANKGKVRHLVKNASLNVRYLREGDSVNESVTEGHYRQTAFPHSIGRRRVWWNSYVDPGLEHRNSYLTWVPADATFVLILCKFEYDRGKWPAQRVFKVPDPASRGGTA